jgi:hypothetical protein
LFRRLVPSYCGLPRCPPPVPPLHELALLSSREDDADGTTARFVGSPQFLFLSRFALFNSCLLWFSAVYWSRCILHLIRLCLELVQCSGNEICGRWHVELIVPPLSSTWWQRRAEVSSHQPFSTMLSTKIQACCSHFWYLNWAEI